MPHRSDALDFWELNLWQGVKAPRRKNSPGGESCCVVKDYAQRVSSTGANPTHAVTHLHTIISAAPADRPVTDGKDGSITLAQGQDFDAGLHPWPLFGEDKLAPVEILARLGQQDRDLKRKDMRAVKVLVKAIEVIRAILEKQRGGSRLTRRMAARQKGIML